MKLTIDNQSKKAGAGVVILLLVLVALLCVSGYYLYQNYPRAATALHINNYNNNLPTEVNASGNITQFETNMRFNHNNLTYFILDCSDQKVARLMEAFSIIENDTNNLITFRAITGEEGADILVGCSQSSFQTEKNVFIAGEGGPTRYLNVTVYPVIIQGKVILYEQSSCDYPVTELHELLHVFGFDHVNDSTKILYPYVGCDQRIDPKLIDMLTKLYLIEPKAELFFSNTSAIKTGIYLNISTEVNNYGMIDANGVTLEVLGDDTKIEDFDLKKIEFGAKETFAIGNMRLNSIDTKKITLKITSLAKEYNEQNNVIELEI